MNASRLFLFCMLSLPMTFADDSGRDGGDKFNEKILKCQKKLLDFIDKNLPEDINNILQEVLYLVFYVFF